MKNTKQSKNNKIPRNIIKLGGFKYFDTGIAADLPSTTSGAIVIPSLNIIPTGTDSKSRVGKKIRIFKIEYQIQLTRGVEINNDTSASNSKVALVLDNATRGSSPSFTDIFESGVFNTFINGANSNRFTILREFNTTLNNYGYWNTNVNQLNMLSFSQRHYGSMSCNIPILFSSTGTTGAVSQTIANCILLTFIGDNVKTALVQVGTAFRIYYIDDN
jgi:hypothetical protein